jgi:hypothetical protein
MPNIWDDAEHAIHTALMQLLALQAQMPEDMPHTATRNRITMAAGHLDDAQDFLSAARARLPKE